MIKPFWKNKAFLLLSFICLVNILDGQENVNPDSLFLLAQDSVYVNRSFAIKQMETCYGMAVDEQDTGLAISSLLWLSKLHNYDLNYIKAYEYAWDALQFSEEYGDSLLLSQANDNLGELYFIYFRSKSSDKFFRQAIEINKDLFEMDSLLLQNLISSYYRQVISNRSFKNYELALVYIDSCLMLANQYNIDTVPKGYIYTEKAKVLSLIGQNKKARKILLDTKRVFENIDKQLSDYNEITGYLVFVYSFLGDIYEKEKDNVNSVHYYNRSLEIMEQYGAHTGMRPYILFRRAFAYRNQENYKLAFESMHQSKMIFDSIYSIKSEGSLALLEIKNDYKEEIEQKDRKILQDSVLLAEQKNKLLRIRISFFVVLFLLIIVVILLKYRAQQLRFKHDREKAEHEQRVSQKAAKELLESKNKELTQSTLQLIEKDKIIAEFIEKSKKRNGEKEIKSFIKSLNLKNNLWEEFNHRFVSVNIGFYDRLSEVHPNLSATDLKHCALIRLNFTGKEMAHLLGISIHSVHISRYRIRKKMNLDRDVNLTNHISKI